MCLCIIQEANKDNGRTAEEEAIRSQESEEDCGDGKSCDKAAESVKQDKTGETLQVKTLVSNNKCIALHHFYYTVESHCC